MSRPAHPVARAIAFSLDYLLLVIWAAALYVASPWLPDAAFATPTWAHASSFVMMTLPVLLYFALFEGRAGATPGKRLRHLVVNRAQDDAHPIGVPRALGRNALKLLPWEIAHAFVHRMDTWPEAVGIGGSVFAMALMLVAAGAIFVGPSRRTLWDRWSGSNVRVQESMRIGT